MTLDVALRRLAEAYAGATEVYTDGETKWMAAKVVRTSRRRDRVELVVRGGVLVTVLQRP